MHRVREDQTFRETLEEKILKEPLTETPLGEQREGCGAKVSVQRSVTKHSRMAGTCTNAFSSGYCERRLRENLQAGPTI